PIQFRVVSQLAVLPAGEPLEGANPKPPVASAVQACDIAVEKMLALWRLRGNGAHAIEPKQAEFGAQPEIPVGRLCDGANEAFRKPIDGFPRGVRVLTDVQTGIQCEGRRPGQEDRADG